MHSSQHASDELVDAVALLHEGNQCSDSAFIVGAASEVRKDELLERVDLILQRHQVRNRLVSLVGIVDRLETDILLIFESS